MSTMIDARLGGGWRHFQRKSQEREGDEPIEMQERRHCYFPQRFLWRGEQYSVDAVERCWTICRRRRDSRVERHCFRVRCPQGTFEIYQDVRHNTWHIKSPVHV